MKIKLLNRTVCRTPVYPKEVALHEVWDSLKQLIYDASPNFFEIIKCVAYEDIENLPQKVKLTIWKYFNRAKFRATPFGGFAAISLVQIAKSDSSIVKLESECESVKFIDWQETISEKLPPILITSYIQSNSTIYRFANEIRFMRSIDGVFQLAYVDYNEFVFHILDHCKTTILAGDLVTLAKTHQYDKDALLDVLNQLQDIELLFSNKKRNITGPDYFQRIGLDYSSFYKYYRLDKRQVISGGLSLEYLKDIEDYLQFTHELNINNQVPGLSRFSFQFKKRFGEEKVPLAQVLDPETGIGYLGLGEQAFSTTDSFYSKEEVSAEAGESEYLDKDLFAFLISGIANGKPINLDHYIPLKISQQHKFPNTFSAVVSFHGDHLFMENLGGCTSNALLGRFTLLDANFENLAHDLTSIEQEANPEIIFFDIAYANDNGVDNVNRRKSCYKSEFSLASWSVSPCPLQLSDIYITVLGDDIILWSKQYQKRIVPRLSSAYNFRRSNFALFRFFCDLQYQNIKTGVSFNLNNTVPGCLNYPRVYYKRIIVSPAMWQVPKTFLNCNIDSSDREVILMSNWLSEIKIGSHFRFGLNDQTLIFDVNNRNELKTFLSIAQQNQVTPIYISETDPSYNKVVDEQSRSYNPQFILNFYHQEPVYAVPSNEFSQNDLLLQNNHQEEKIYLPGSKWVYFEVYCHTIRSNQILLTNIIPLINRYENLIDKWFFIRFTSPAPHLRVRIKFFDKKFAIEFLMAFESAFKAALTKGYITDFQIKTYHPELQRYDVVGIDTVEKFFFLDSLFVAALLNRGFSQNQLYAVTIWFLNAVLGCLYSGTVDKLNLAIRVANGFAKELKWNRTIFKEVNKNYKILDFLTQDEFLGSNCHIYDQLIKQVETFIPNLGDKYRYEKMVVDLLHMHINRLFSENQRVHEGLLYQYLTIYLKKLQAQEKRLPIL